MPLNGVLKARVLWAEHGIIQPSSMTGSQGMRKGWLGDQSQEQPCLVTEQWEQENEL